MFDLRELAVPVVAAPMAGGPSTPELAAAVSGAGGLGFLAAGYKTADRVAQEFEAVRAATSAPVGVNLFLVEPTRPDAGTLDAYGRSLEPEAARLGVELGEPHFDDDRWQAKLELVLDVRPDVVSFTFGCPTADVLGRLIDAHVVAMVTVTSAAEASAAVSRGAAALSVQGPDAGGHRGTWNPLATPGTTPLHELIAEVRAVTDVPVMAGGGVASAAEVAALLAEGALAAQVGTAYLLAPEAGTNALHRKALLDPRRASTTLTRAYTGRWARGLANRFIAEHTDAPAGYPEVHHLTAPLRAEAVAAADAEVAHMWAGTQHARARAVPAAEITRSLTP